MESKTKTILNELNNSFLIIYEQFWIYFLFMVKLISSCRFKTPQNVFNRKHREKEDGGKTERKGEIQAERQKD